MADYNEIYKVLPRDIEFTATQVGYASATLSAMVRRGFLEDVPNTKPKKFKVIDNSVNAAKIKTLMEISSTIEFITVYYEDRELRELLVHKNTSWLHYDGKTPLSQKDISRINKIEYYVAAKKPVVFNFCKNAADIVK